MEAEEEAEAAAAARSQPQKLEHGASWIDGLLTKRTSSLPSEATKDRPPRRRPERGGVADRVATLHETVEELDGNGSGGEDGGEGPLGEESSSGGGGGGGNGRGARPSVVASLALEAETLRADLAEERQARAAAEARAEVAEARAAAAELLLKQIGAAATERAWRAGTAVGEAAAAEEAK